MNAVPVKPAGQHQYHSHNVWFFFTSGNSLTYATRTTLAGIAALLAAMWLQLDVPRWALWTVVVVSPPVRGNALRKTASRAIGTLIGCVAGVALVGLFPQDRVFFYLTFATWLAACAYYGTIRRGYVSYAAILAGFTSAIISADVDSIPQEVFPIAIARGSCTLLGVLFAWGASEMAARSDDAPRDLANRICAVAAGVLEWAMDYVHRHLDLTQHLESEDAPLTGKILALDEIGINAISERPALNRVKNWIVGVPTALLSLQTAVIRIGRDARAGKVNRPLLEQLHAAVVEVHDVLKSGADTPLPALRRQCASLALLNNHLNAAETEPPSIPRARNDTEIVAALRFLLTTIRAIIMLKQPDLAPAGYPAPTFMAQRTRARLNVYRTFAGVLLGFLIWDATAWTADPAFLTNVCVALVVYVSLDNPVVANRTTLLGTIIGSIVGIAVKFLILPWSDNPLWLSLVLFPVVAVGVWAQTRPKLAALGFFYVNALLILIEPTNPQQYNLADEMNSLVAVVAAFSFVPLVFLLIGTPKTGRDRVEELLHRIWLRLHWLRYGDLASDEQRLGWQTRMYDGIQTLQAESKDPQARAAAVDLLLTGLADPRYSGGAVQ